MQDEAISYLDLFKIIHILLDDEERIYPRSLGKCGDELLKRAITYILQGKDPAAVYTEFMNNKNPKTMGHCFFDPKEWVNVFCDKCHEQAFCPTCNEYIKCRSYIWKQKGD